MNMHVDHSTDSEFNYFERKPQHLKTFAFTLKQNSMTKDVFSGQIAIYFETPSAVEVEVIARSDDSIDPKNCYSSINILIIILFISII